MAKGKTKLSSSGVHEQVLIVTLEEKKEWYFMHREHISLFTKLVRH
jgi:hypothetical protein